MSVRRGVAGETRGTSYRWESGQDDESERDETRAAELLAEWYA